MKARTARNARPCDVESARRGEASKQRQHALVAIIRTLGPGAPIASVLRAAVRSGPAASIAELERAWARATRKPVERSAESLAIQH